MTVAENLGPLVGRAVEIEVLRSEVAAVRTGIPRIVVVQGDAGIGKTALIENVLAAEHGLAVLRTSGEPWEASVSHGVIDQLMCVSGIDASHPVAARGRHAAPRNPVSSALGFWTRSPSSGRRPRSCWPAQYRN